MFEQDPHKVKEEVTHLSEGRALWSQAQSYPKTQGQDRHGVCCAGTVSERLGRERSHRHPGPPAQAGYRKAFTEPLPGWEEVARQHSRPWHQHSWHTQYFLCSKWAHYCRIWDAETNPPSPTLHSYPGGHQSMWVPIYSQYEEGVSQEKQLQPCMVQILKQSM